ncbi:MAG: S1C family serine protease [Lautropia sp.]
MKRASLYSGSRRRRGVEPAAPASASAVESRALESRAVGSSADAPPGPGAGASSGGDAGAARSRRGQTGAAPDLAPTGAGTAQGASPGAAPRATRRARLRSLASRVGVPFASALVAVALWNAFVGGGVPGQRPITQEVIDAAVLNTLETQSLPSASARAAQIIAPSVVRVRAYGPVEAKDKPERGEKGKAKAAAEEEQKGVGTGVIIKDNGLILSNLHVVAGAKRISIVFADGSESDATLTGARPEHDLAVLQPKTLPDDIQPATLRSTGDLREGDGVVAVGFPFDIGPSVSAGVISGFKREYRSTSGERVLSNLIQFDAAANPGNSGGPLVTLEGEVVGIVTAILNPNNQRSFVGIAFAVPIENAASAAGIPPH